MVGLAKITSQNIINYMIKEDKKMKRKDILIISAILVVISFITVFTMYYILNDGNIFSKGTEEVAKTESQYYSNGWEKAIVSEIKYKVPIPVGFTYVEGKKNEGLIIKNNETGEEYVWVPTADSIINHEEYAEIVVNMGLEDSSEETAENVEKYEGFYVAIDRNSQTDTNQIKEKLANMSEDERRKLELDNESLTSIAETHTVTADELASIISWDSDMKNMIDANKMRALTLSSSADEEDNDNTVATDEVDSRIAKKHPKEEAYIPAGFTYKEGTVETGFKITNGDNLNYIWIPVEEIAGNSDLKDDLLDGEVTEEDMKSAEEAIKNKFKENMTEEYEKGYSDYLENASDRKEDTKEDNSEYEELLKSIAKYGGFYISEAELGYDANGHIINKYRPMIKAWGEEYGYNYVSNGDYFRNISDGNKNTENKSEKFQDAQKFTLTYDNAVGKSKELYNISSTVNSHLTYGLEYNAVVNYLVENGKKVVGGKEEKITLKALFEDSTKIGKYQALKDGTKSLWEKEAYINGIYGLAGNLAELTQEVITAENEEGNKVEQVVLRGGSWFDSGNEKPLAYVGPAENSSIKEDVETIGFRACLYIKPEYEEIDLSGEVQNYINELKDHIAGKSVKIDGDDTNYFNTNEIDSNGDGEKDRYEINILNIMVNQVKGKLNNEKSTAAMSKIVQDGKDAIDLLVNHIDNLMNYNDIVVELTNGKTITSKDMCWNMKIEALQEIENLKWLNGKLKNEKGEEKTYQNIVESTTNLIKALMGQGSENLPYVYEGEWEKEIPDGWVKITYEEGNGTYEGGFKDGKAFGYGEYTDKDNKVTKAFWNIDAGEESETISFEYKVTYRDGNSYVVKTVSVNDKYYTIESSSIIKPTEEETSENENEYVYKGEYKEGIPDGKVRINWPGIGVYDGEWKDGKMHGQGKMTYADGTVYDGGWKDNKIHGQGTYTWADGGQYVGEFLDGKANGQGTMTWPSGVVDSGLWKDGVFIESEGNKASIIDLINGITLEGATEDQTNRFNTAKENLTNTINNTDNEEGIKAAESFYWTQPLSWDNKGLWEVEYIIRKINAMTGIITGDIDPEKEMEDINNWIAVRQDVFQIAEKFKYGQEEYKAGDYSYYESWKDKEQSMRNTGYEYVLESIDVEDAKKRATYQLGLINQMIAEVVAEKNAENNSYIDNVVIDDTVTPPPGDNTAKNNAYNKVKDIKNWRDDIGAKLSSMNSSLPNYQTVSSYYTKLDSAYTNANNFYVSGNYVAVNNYWTGAKTDWTNAEKAYNSTPVVREIYASKSQTYYGPREACEAIIAAGMGRWEGVKQNTSGSPGVVLKVTGQKTIEYNGIYYKIVVGE